MLDWDDLKFFLAVARHRDLGSAAKLLNVTQSTISRRVISLQEDMGRQLLQRSADGYVMTAVGESILAHVERVEAETLLVEHTVSGHDPSAMTDLSFKLDPQQDYAPERDAIPAANSVSELHSAASQLSRSAVTHAEATKARGDQIDAVLAQIRSVLTQTTSR